MSARSVDPELIREQWRHWNEHGLNPAFVHPEVEWTTPRELPGAATYIGREAVASFLREWEGTTGIVHLSFEIEEIIPAGDKYLIISLAQGSGESGAAIPAHNWFHLFEMEDGLLRRAQLFLDRAEALRAAGLAE